MKFLIAVWKLACGLAHALCGWFTIRFVFPRLDAPARSARVRAWALRMLEVADIELELHGEPPATGPMLLVSNHIS